MLTFRKSLVVAAFVLACLYLFTNHHTAARATQSAASTAAQLAGISKPHSQGKLAETPKSTSSLKSSSSKTKSLQKPLNPGPGSPMVDRLRFQYPYDPEGKFPAYIWQTWKVQPSSDKFADNLRPQEASWTEKHPGFVHEVITDDVAAHLVRYLYNSVPEVLDAYESMPIAVLKADFFRYLILLARGGIYSDIDTEALKSAAEWMPDEINRDTVGLVVGIEADPDRPDWADWYSRRIQFCQWTIQAKPGHPVLRSIVAQITEETLKRKAAGTLKNGPQLHKGIIEYTGPARWTDTIFSYFNDGDFFDVKKDVSTGGEVKNITWREFTGIKDTKKVGDVLVLPITSFSPDVGTMGAGDKDDPMAFVKHDFEGEL